MTRDPNEPIVKGNGLNVRIPSKKHPYNIKLDDQQKQTQINNMLSSQTPDQEPVKVVAGPPDRDYLVSTEDVSPSNVLQDLGSKRHDDVHNALSSHIDKKNKKKMKGKMDKHSHSELTVPKKKDNNKKKHHKNVKKGPKKKKSKNIADIFSTLLGEDSASGSGEKLDLMASGSGLAEKIHEVESNLLHTFKSKNLLAEEKKKKKKIKTHPKLKKRKAKHSSAEKKNKAGRPDDAPVATMEYHNATLSSDFGFNKHSTMENVDVELIQALSPGNTLVIMFYLSNTALPCISRYATLVRKSIF